MKLRNKKKIFPIIFLCVVIVVVTIIIVKANSNSNETFENNDFSLIYNQNGKNELIKIIDKNTSKDYDYDVYTYGGDVTIEINGETYNFKDALERKVINVDNIITKAKNDAQNKICREATYLDGGSIEYWYSDYTILKYNKQYVHNKTRKDVVIGMKKEIIDKVDNILEANNSSDESSTLSEGLQWLESY